MKKGKSGEFRGRSFGEAKGIRGGELSGREQIRCILEGIGIVFLLAWFFYQSVLALPL